MGLTPDCLPQSQFISYRAAHPHRAVPQRTSELRRLKGQTAPSPIPLTSSHKTISSPAQLTTIRLPRQGEAGGLEPMDPACDPQSDTLPVTPKLSEALFPAVCQGDRPLVRSPSCRSNVPCPSEAASLIAHTHDECRREQAGTPTPGLTDGSNAASRHGPSLVAMGGCRTVHYPSNAN